MGTTTELRRTLKARFFTHAVDRGFVMDDSYQPHRTAFRRRVGNSVQIFELQWDKYGRPRFVLHFGTCPVEGLHLGGTIHRPEDTLSTWCPDRGSLQPRRGTSTRSWFRQDSTVLQRMLGRPPLRHPDEVVGELLCVFPELERYWSNAEVGPHLRQW